MSCPDAFNCLNLEIKNSKTYISSCCIMPTWEVDTIDFVNDKNLKRIREQWNNGIWPSECNACKIHEELTNNSRRQGAIQWHNTNIDLSKDYSNKILKIDYWAGNNCNLRCAICGPRYSIAWKKELGIKKSQRVTHTNQLWKDIAVDDLQWIHFNGGEPLLIDDHWELLAKIEHKDQVVLNYNTNASVLPKKELVNLWSQFKMVILDFSIDDIEERFDYQRYPAKWNRVVENLFWLRENMPVNVMFEINTSIGLLNYQNYNNLQKWVQENFPTNRVTDPVVLKTQPTVGLLQKNIKDKNKVVDYLDKLDSRRGSNWKKTFPELVDFLLN